MKIKVVVLIGLLSILLVSGLSCGASAPTTYQLTTVVEGQGNVAPSSGTYIAGDSITLTAIPSSGWSFNHWAFQKNRSSNPLNITMDADKTVYANFVETLTTSTGEESAGVESSSWYCMQGKGAYRINVSYVVEGTSYWTTNQFAGLSIEYISNCYGDLEDDFVSNMDLPWRIDIAPIAGFVAELTGLLIGNGSMTMKIYINGELAAWKTLDPNDDYACISAIGL